MRPSGPLATSVGATLAAVLAASAGVAGAQNYDTRQTYQTDNNSAQSSQPYNPNYNQGDQQGYSQQGYQQGYGLQGYQTPPADQQAYDAARRDYQSQQQDYQQRQQQYRDQQASYQARQYNYQDQRARYETERARWEAARAAYDARWGEGAYVRVYGPFQETEVYADGPYRGYASTSPGDWYASYRDTPCEQRRHDRAVAGTVIGALAGAALGSNIASGGGRTGGAIIGALAGGAVGNNIARSTAHCDATGGYYWYSYDDTYPWRDSGDDIGNHSAHWYRKHGCRLVSAPIDTPDGTDWRWAPVCPGPDGRYRFAS